MAGELDDLRGVVGDEPVVAMRRVPAEQRLLVRVEPARLEHERERAADPPRLAVGPARADVDVHAQEPRAGVQVEELVVGGIRAIEQLAQAIDEIGAQARLARPAHVRGVRRRQERGPQLVGAGALDVDADGEGRPHPEPPSLVNVH